MSSDFSTDLAFDPPTLSEGRYQIQQCIGVGGMAGVFKAYDSALQVERALKVLKPEYLLGTDIRKRFQKEAIAMANLKHQNIVQVYDLGMEGMTMYIVMEYIPYGSVRRYIQKHGRLSIGQATSICLDIAKALGYAHSQGFVHRDVKPDNILLTDQGAQLSDFGIAKDTVSESNDTKTNAMMGTVPYMSPEQRLNAKNITAQADIYALVATFFHLLTQQDVMDLFVEEVRTELVVDLPESVQDIIHKGCCMDLEMRYDSTSELIEDLEAILKVEPCEPLNLVPMESPSLENTQLEELQRVWDRYTGSETDSDLTHLPMYGLHSNSTPSSGETWVNVHHHDEDVFISPDAPTHQSETSNVDHSISQSETDIDRPTFSHTYLWVLGGILTLFFVGLISQSENPSILNQTDDALGILEISDQDALAVTQFEQAKQLILDGNLNEAARLLSALHANGGTQCLYLSDHSSGAIYTASDSFFSVVQWIYSSG